MCWSGDWQSRSWRVETAIFSCCFPNFLILPPSLSFTVVLLLFPLPALYFHLRLATRPPSSSHRAVKAGSRCWQTTTYRSIRWPRLTRACTAARPASRPVARSTLWTSLWSSTVSCILCRYLEDLQPHSAMLERKTATIQKYVFMKRF